MERAMKKNFATLLDVFIGACLLLLGLLLIYLHFVYIMPRVDNLFMLVVSKILDLGLGACGIVLGVRRIVLAFRGIMSSPDVTGKMQGGSVAVNAAIMRFMVTFLWSAAIYFLVTLILIGIAMPSATVGVTDIILGVAVASVLCGMVAILIPVSRKAIYVSAAMLIVLVGRCFVYIVQSSL